MNEIFIIMFVVIAVIMVILVMYSFSKTPKKENTSIVPEISPEEEVHYFRKPFMTRTEKDLFYKMKRLESELNVHVLPQISLASVIRKESRQRYQNELNRIIDFGIFDHDYTKLLLLVELNDPTHNMPERKRRDHKVRSICKEAGIKIMTFYTNKQNEELYVQNRIKEELSSELVQKEKTIDNKEEVTKM